jgi:Cu/Ag efflux pump CusA
VNTAEFDVRFRSSGRPKPQVITNVRSVADSFPGFVWGSKQYISERMDEVLSGSTAAVVMKVFGPDLDELDRISAEVQSVAARVPGVADLQRVQQTETPELEIRFDRNAAQAYGLTSEQVATAVQTAFLGTTVGTVLEEQKSFDLVVKFPDRYKADLQAIKGTLIDAGDAKVPLGEVAQVHVVSAPNAIARENGSRVAVVQCNVEDRDLVSFVTDLRTRLQRSVKLPDGYSLEYGGQFESRANATRRIQLVGLAALGGIVLLLYSAFSSFRHTVLVLFNIPMAFLGGVAAVLLSGSSISIATLIGFITLFGITARNGIMLISHYQHLQREESEQFGPDMVIRGASERLLPILMTALATALALLPVALAPNRPGRELEQPMALVILGGLATSTALNLLVMPTLFLRYGRTARLNPHGSDEG